MDFSVPHSFLLNIVIPMSSCFWSFFTPIPFLSYVLLFMSSCFWSSLSPFLFILCSFIHVFGLLALFPFFSPSDLYSMSLSLFRLYCHPHLYMCFSVHVFPVILWLHLCVFHLSSDHTFMSSLLPCDLLLCSPIYSVTVLRAFLLFFNPLSFSSLYPCAHLSILLTLISFLTLLLIM